MSMAENEAWEVQGVLDDVDELQDPSLDDRNIKMLIPHDVNSESRSQTGLQGVEVKDPTQKSRGQWQPGRDQRPQGNGKVADARTTSKPSV